MEIEVLDDPGAVAAAGARFIAAAARKAVAARGRFVAALSGGRTPWAMFRLLATLDLPWSGIQIFQVDERVVPAGDVNRSLDHLRNSLLIRAPLSA